MYTIYCKRCGLVFKYYFHTICFKKAQLFASEKIFNLCVCCFFAGKLCKYVEPCLFEPVVLPFAVQIACLDTCPLV